MAFKYGRKLGNVMRGLRTNICSFIKLQPKDLEKLQRDLALNFSRQRCKSSTYEGDSMAANSSSSSFNGEVVVVPHEIEGVFIAKGRNKEALLCTKNLVPGERVYGEQLITFKNEDGIKIEYRVWNPLTSKLAALIENGSKSIWMRPGSRVFYLGDVCGTTVSHLSDIVGPEGLVYALGKSDSVLRMVEKRSNIIVIYDSPQLNRHRMFLSMVDVICADLTTLSQVHMVAMHATHYLRVGGHCLMSVKAKWVVSSSNGGTTLDRLGGLLKKELKLIKVIELEPIIKDHVMAVSVFRNVEA